MSRSKNLYILKLTEPVEKFYTIDPTPLGKGQYGCAYKAVCKENKKPVAIKSISKAFLMRGHNNDDQIERLRSEIAIMRDLRHKNLVQLYDVFENVDTLFLVMELCPGGELFDRITDKSRYSERDAAFVLRQILEGLAFMHSQKIAHCDLKPDNFLFSSKDKKADLKIIDFGMSKKLKRRQEMSSLRGTPYYIAPEVLSGNYSECCDMWSFGVVMFVMLFGYPPFFGDTDNEIFERIKKGFYPETRKGYGPFFAEAIPISDGAKHLLKHLLEKDTAKRFTAQEALEHPWVNGEGVSETPMPSAVLKGVAQVNLRSKFTKSLLNYVSTSVISREETSKLATLFKKIDTNSDGFLTHDELKQALNTMERKEDVAQVQELIEMADMDGDGKISWMELMMASSAKYLASKEERIWKAFKSLDKDGNGVLSREEIQSALADDSSEALEMIKEADKDGSGDIDYDEFLAVFTKASEKQLHTGFQH